MVLWFIIIIIGLDAFIVLSVVSAEGTHQPDYETLSPRIIIIRNVHD